MVKKLISRLKNTKGLALSELMIATAVLSFLITGVGNVYVNGQQSFFYIEGSAENMQEARYGAEQISRDLRSTIQITSGSADQFVFDGDYDGDGTTESITYSKVTSSSGFQIDRTIGGVTKTVAEGVVNSASEPVFKYYDQEGVAQTDGTLATLVELELKVDKEPDKSPNRSTTITTKIQLRNMHERR